jgi:hypothetical protein
MEKTGEKVELTEAQKARCERNRIKCMALRESKIAM